MKAASLKEIKTELNQRSTQELLELCLRLSRFKKENKELLTYLLFESEDEAAFIQSIKNKVDEDFETINTKTFYHIKKSIRKVLRELKKFIRYSQNKETEVELLLYFCHKLKDFKPSIKRNTTLTNLYNRQIDYISKKVKALHEDLQYDYELELKELGP
jgi:predicted nucleotide-binding protein (sugar kinase/HSP70/actin superfamily)